MMLRYYFDLSEGRLGRSAENGQKCAGNVLLMSKAEFAEWKEPLFYKKNLTGSVQNIKYCKLDKLKRCIQGTMLIPPGIEGEKALHFGFYADNNQLIFLEDGSVLRKLLDKMTQRYYEVSSLNELLLVIFEIIVEDDILNIQGMETQLCELEEQLVRSVPEHFNETLMRYRRKLSLYHAYYQQLMNIADSMQDNISKEVTEEECIAWQRYGCRVERLHNYVETLREYLIQIREMYQSKMEEQQNRVMSLLTVITTIFFPLTLIAGWYGMNFPNMPELGWELGYPVIIVVSLAIIIAEILYFKRKHML